MVQHWPRVANELLFSTPVFNVHRRRQRSPRTEQAFDFFVIDAPDWVNVVALTEDEQVLFVRQYRCGSDEITLEIPGGMIDESDGDPVAAARRELREETGYVADSVEYIGAVAPNPALQNNRCHTCVARQLRPAEGQKLDSGEDIEVVSVPLAEVPTLIRGGTISHALVVVAFCWHLGLATSRFDRELRLR